MLPLSTIKLRSFPWRYEPDPYKVLISEFMLQQTQTSRVVEKYISWIDHFPTSVSVATATTSDILRQWVGLGYNRRALSLQRACQQIVNQFSGHVPASNLDLISLPGVGSATAGAIQVYAYNLPALFLETNIRTVLIHHFFSNSTSPVSDAQLFPCLEKELDTQDPRTWYYKVVDYGVLLKKAVGNLNKKSATYTKQTKFEGSNRQKRAALIRTLLTQPFIKKTPDNTDIIKQLLREQFIIQLSDGTYTLK